MIFGHYWHKIDDEMGFLNLYHEFLTGEQMPKMNAGKG